MASSIRLRAIQEIPESCRLSETDKELLQCGRHPDPASVLGPQLLGGCVVIRCWVSGAEAVTLVASSEVLGSDDAEVPLRLATGMDRVPWLFEVAFEFDGASSVGSTAELRSRLSYNLQVRYAAGGGSCKWYDPYSFGDLLATESLKMWAAGSPSENPASLFGSHHMELHPAIWGTRFALWAPHAKAVSIIGDFNHWDAKAHPLCSRSDYGVWELFLPVWDLRGQKYGFQVVQRDGTALYKIDAFATEFVDPSGGGHDAKVPECDDYSRLAWKGGYGWQDDAWLQRRIESWGLESWTSMPLSIYEVHLQSWMAGADGKPLGYRALAKPLAEHVEALGFTAVEFLPLSQYPCEASWGYQCAGGLYAVDARLGTPDDFKFLVDSLHARSIAVFVDFVGAHFAKDPWGLTQYAGAAQFEYDGPLGELPGWGTARFDFSKPEVCAYITGAVDYWVEHLHVDGLRLDAVTSMVYRNFGREEDGDAILAGRGEVNEEAVLFLQKLCQHVRSRHPGVLLMAEESANFKWVTPRTPVQGSERQNVGRPDLGFHLKWNMGFAYDALAFMQTEEQKRPHLDVFGWKKLAWYLAYAYNERWVLPFSHDSAQPQGLVEKMAAADTTAQVAQLEVLLAYTVAMPGRKLFFMGTEVGAPAWSFAAPIDWEAAKAKPENRRVSNWLAQLLRLYRSVPALHCQDDEKEGFSWVDMDKSNRSIFAFRRHASGSQDVLVLLNFSSEPARGYRAPLGPGAAGVWRCLVPGPNGQDAPTAAEGGLAPGAGEPTTGLVEAHDPVLKVDLPGYGAQFWQAPGEASVTFEVRHPGLDLAREELRVVGSCQELGAWKPESGARMCAKPQDEKGPVVWKVDIKLVNPPGLLEFKYVVMRQEDGSVAWEPLEFNRKLTVHRGATMAAVAEFGRP